MIDVVALGWLLIIAGAAYLGRLFYVREIRPYRGVPRGFVESQRHRTVKRP